MKIENNKSKRTTATTTLKNSRGQHMHGINSYKLQTEGPSRRAPLACCYLIPPEIYFKQVGRSLTTNDGPARKRKERDKFWNLEQKKKRREEEIIFEMRDILINIAS